jgi:hypothetical protein
MVASTVVHEVMTVRISEPHIYLELWMVMTASDGNTKQHREHSDTDFDADANCDIDATTGAGAVDKDNIDHPGIATGVQPQDPHVNFRRVERHRGAFPPCQW